MFCNFMCNCEFNSDYGGDFTLGCSCRRELGLGLATKNLRKCVSNDGMKVYRLARSRSDLEL
jgi:hypothetical protein